MAKTATLKDVLYGLQYAGQQLCRWPTMKADGKATWSLEPSGIKVPGHVADKARETGMVVTVPANRYGEARYAWQQRDAA